MISNRNLIDTVRTRAMSLAFDIRWLILEMADRLERASEPAADMPSGPCRFCDMLAMEKRFALTHGDGFYQEYSAALVSRIMKNGIPHGRHTHGNHALRYCPECGRKLT